MKIPFLELKITEVHFFETCTTFLVQNDIQKSTKGNLDPHFWSGAVQDEPGRPAGPARPPGRPVGCFAGGEGGKSAGEGQRRGEAGAPPLLSPQVGYLVYCLRQFNEFLSLFLILPSEDVEYNRFY